MPQTLAQMVRAKYPGAYDDLSDQELESAVRAKFPGVYDDLPSTETEQAGPVRRFVGGAAEMLNPVAMAQGVYQAVRHPVDTLTNIASAQVEQGRKAIQAGREGRYSEMVGHGGAALLPIVGPVAADVGEQIGKGDVAGGLGKGMGLLTTMAVVPAARAVKAKAVAQAPRLEQAAAANVADLMTPRVGANKVRLGNQAEKIAPKLAERLPADGAPLTRSGFHAKVQEKLAGAEQMLDDAAQARPNQMFPTKPIIDALKAKRAQYEVSGSSGKRIVPTPNAERVAQIDRAIKEVQKLGTSANYDAIKSVRQAYDQVAKPAYSPAVTPEYLKAAGGAQGAADVTGVLRESLARFDPRTAAANAEYSLYRSADDLLSAVDEVERARPKMFRRVMTTLGAATAGTAGGVPGVIAGLASAAALDVASAAGVTMQLKRAALYQRLATSLRNGNVGATNSALAQLQRLTPTVGATTPTERRPTPAGARP